MRDILRRRTNDLFGDVGSDTLQRILFWEYQYYTVSNLIFQIRDYNAFGDIIINNNMSNSEVLEFVLSCKITEMKQLEDQFTLMDNYL